jgi:hypothetical protein
MVQLSMSALLLRGRGWHEIVVGTSHESVSFNDSFLHGVKETCLNELIGGSMRSSD